MENRAQNNSTKITMLGTGHAMVTKCYNTCFLIQDDKHYFMVDAGGGNGILRQLEKLQISSEQVSHLFVTHTHTDHVLGVVWMIRDYMQKTRDKQLRQQLTVYCHETGMQVIWQLCNLLFCGNQRQYIKRAVRWHTLRDGERIDWLGRTLTFFDTHSSKLEQYGMHMQLVGGKTFCYMGDEPYNRAYKSYAKNVDWLMTEAFCLYEDRELFCPYEKSHTTAKEAAHTAAELRATNLILTHTEDERIKHRKELYTQEAASVFDGNIFVPNDLETIQL